MQRFSISRPILGGIVLLVLAPVQFKGERDRAAATRWGFMAAPLSCEIKASDNFNRVPQAFTPRQTSSALEPRQTFPTCLNQASENSNCGDGIGHRCNLVGRPFDVLGEADWGCDISPERAGRSQTRRHRRRAQGAHDLYSVRVDPLDHSPSKRFGFIPKLGLSRQSPREH